jgi:hypothetical protein
MISSIPTGNDIRIFYFFPCFCNKYTPKIRGCRIFRVRSIAMFLSAGNCIFFRVLLAIGLAFETILFVVVESVSGFPIVCSFCRYFFLDYFFSSGAFFLLRHEKKKSTQQQLRPSLKRVSSVQSVFFFVFCLTFESRANALSRSIFIKISSAVFFSFSSTTVTPSNETPSLSNTFSKYEKRLVHRIFQRFCR